VVQAFLGRGYNVVATSRSVSKAGFAPSPNLALVDGDIGQAATASNIAQTAISKFGSIDDLVNNAGVFLVKPFTDYTAEDFRSLVATNLEGFFFITQLAVTADAVTGHRRERDKHHGLTGPAPNRWSSGFDFDAHQGRTECDYSEPCERVCEEQHPLQRGCARAVDTPIVKGIPKDFLMTLSPMGAISEAKDIADAVIYLTEARHITGEVLHVDGGMHVGKW